MLGKAGDWLKWVLRLDGAVSFGFGLATVIWQFAIFSTAVDLGSAGAMGSGTSLMESTLLVLSGYYMLVGSLALALATAPPQHAVRLALLLAVHHIFMGIKGGVESAREWMTGDPWSDVVIHAAFALAYVALVSLQLKRRAV